MVDSGVITTGIRAGAAALWGDTAQLPEVEITRPDTILGTNTKTCMQAGLYYTFLGGVERTIRQFRKELGGEDFKVITTGGLGRVFANDTEPVSYTHLDVDKRQGDGVGGEERHTAVTHANPPWGLSLIHILTPMPSLASN